MSPFREAIGPNTFRISQPESSMAPSSFAMEVEATCLFSTVAIHSCFRAATSALVQIFEILGEKLQLCQLDFEGISGNTLPAL
jgi:hypothetical protein